MKQKELFKLINESISKHIDNMCLNESIQKAINEELGISNEIVQAAQELKETIISDYHNLKPYKVFFDIKYYTNVIHTKIFDKHFKIQYVIGNCKDKIAYQRHYSEFTGKTYLKNNCMYIVLGFINNVPQMDVDSTTYHELTHVYQYIKRDNDTLFQKRLEPLYNKSVEVTSKNIKYANSNCVENNYFNLGFALYNSFKCEQDAFFHSFESEMKDFALMWPSKIFDTEVYNNLRCIQYVIKDYDKLKKYVKILFGINEQEYLNILKKAEKRILRCIGRVLVKHMNNETNNLGNQMTTTPYFMKNPLHPLKTDKH